MNEQYLSVGQVNSYIKNIFEAEVMLQNICIYGEVSSYKVSNNIAYFNLTDESGLISCVLFNASKFVAPNIGDVVLVVGSVSYYAKGGKLSFNAYQIAPYGKGLLYEKFLKLKAELEAKGYFDLSRKKQLSQRVKKIGVVIIRKYFDCRREFVLTQMFKVIMNCIQIVVFLFIWDDYIKDLMTLISVVSAALTIALRELILNFFCG